MASPLAKDLFAGAIGESGSLLSARRGSPTLAESEQNGVKFGAAIGASSLAALRGLSAIELLDASARPDAVGFGPVVDGYFFPQSPGAIYAAGAQAHVPLLAGWNSEESGPRGVLQETPTPDNVAKLLSTTFGAQAEQAARVYPASNAEEALQAATDLASDRFIAYSTWKWLEEHGRTSGKPVYRYLFSRPRPPVINAAAGSSAPRGAVHSAEIEYAMGNLPTNKVFAWTPDDYKVSEAMQGYFANFIKTGQPNGPGLPNWPIGTVGSDSRVMRMRIDVTPRVEPEPRPRYLFLDQFFAQPTH
jgi:para-nitrobenzyl esterase